MYLYLAKLFYFIHNNKLYAPVRSWIPPPTPSVALEILGREGVGGGIDASLVVHRLRAEKNDCQCK